MDHVQQRRPRQGWRSAGCWWPRRRVPPVLNDMEGRDFIVARRVSLAACCYVLLTAVVCASVHKHNLLTSAIFVNCIVCLIASCLGNVVFMFDRRAHRQVYFLMAVGFAIHTYVMLFASDGRGALQALHQHRRDQWFLKTGRPAFETYLAQNTNTLGKSWAGGETYIPEVQFSGRRNADGSIECVFGLIGGVPRQGYLYHTGDLSQNFPREYRLVRMITNHWYDVIY